MGTIRVATAASLLAAVVVVPGLLYPYVVPRAVWFRICVAVAAAAAAVLMLRLRPRIQLRRDLPGAALTAFLVVSVLAAAFGVAPTRSFFGDLERMGGVWTLLHLWALYFLLRTFFEPEHWGRLIRALSVLGGVVAVSALTDRIGLGVIDQLPSRRPDGVLGNPGFMGGLMLLVVPVAITAMAWAKGRERAVHGTVIALAAVALVLSLSRAALLGGFVGVLVAATAWGWGRGRRGLTVALAATALVVGIGSFVLIRASPAGEGFRAIPTVERAVSLSLEGGSAAFRLLAWRAGLEAGADRWFLGWGPENELQAISAVLTPGYYRWLPLGNRVDRSHNAFVDVWATTGALGLLAYLLFWIALVRAVTTAWRRDAIPAVGAAALIGGLSAHAVHLFFWMPDLTGWVYLVVTGAFAATMAHGSPPIRFDSRERPAAPWLAPLVVVVAVGLVWAQAVQPLLQAGRLHAAEEVADAAERLDRYESALRSGATQQLQAILRHERFIQELFTDPALRGNLFAVARILDSAERGLVAIRREMDRDPRNDVLLGRLASLQMVRYQATGDTAAVEEAIAAIDSARVLAPGKTRYEHLLSQIHLAMGDTAAARRILEEVLERGVAFGETYTLLARTAHYAGDATAAAGWLERAAEEGWRSPQPDLSVRVAESLREEAPGRGARVLELYLASWYPVFSADTLGRGRRFTMRPEDLAVLNRIPLLWTAAGDMDRARIAAAMLAGQEPELAPVARSFGRALGTDAWSGEWSSAPFLVDSLQLDSLARGTR